MTDSKDRVAIWNSIFKLAWTEAKQVYESNFSCKSKDNFTPAGGTLPEDMHHCLAAVILCTLAIEARANHIIEEMVESERISEEVGEAVRWLPTKQKWFLLPTLAGVTNTLCSNSGPHQAIAQLCDLRNDVIHVKYDKLQENLPSAKQLLSYFKRFVEAMEDMNVVLKRSRTDGPLKEILDIGEFHSE